VESLTVSILGKDYPVKLPPQFAVKEELIVAYGESEGNTSQRQRVCAAVLGICTDLGRQAGADYVKARFNVLAYGGAVYGWLREQGAEMEDVPTAAAPLVRELFARVFPRKPEVEEAKAGFPAGAAG
jgi:hypothetical protein